jgi:glycosyltransferase involved in cell wall biosynthesis
MREWGFRSEVFAGHFEADLTGDVFRVQDYEKHSQPADGAILHYSIGSPAYLHAAVRASWIALHYHNITPARFLWDHSPTIAAECARGRRELGQWAERVAASCADSEYNAAELRQFGFAEPSVVGVLRRPLVLPAIEPRPSAPPRLIFVGRGMPNKAQHDLILALAALHEMGIPATLDIIGTWGGAKTYLEECRRLADRLGVMRFIDVTESLDDVELGRRYRDATVFVCLSDHEGYCVPAVEAMEADLPIVAYSAGALPETVGRAGLLLPEKTPSLVAEAVLEVSSNLALAASFAEGRREQLEKLGPDAVAERLRAFVNRVT